MTDEIDWYGPEAATFGDRVAAAREQTGMTQAMLAKRLGVRLAKKTCPSRAPTGFRCWRGCSMSL